MTDAAGNEWTWDYDLAGNEVSVDDPTAGSPRRGVADELEYHHPRIGPGQ
ncbi:RHS repeat protein [Cumulibacter soli]